MSACRGGMVEGTAVTESLHKWNTTPCTIASHKPELWCKCFSNMAWIYPCILRLKNAFFTSFKRETKEGYNWYTLGPGAQMHFMQTITNNVDCSCELYSPETRVSSAWATLALRELELMITNVFPTVSPFHFGDKFTKTGFRMPVSMKTVYWGADKGC